MFNKNYTYIVTGATGYVGNCLCKKLFVVNGFSVKVNEVGNLLINGKEVNLKDFEKMIYDLISEGLHLIVEKNEDSEEVENAKELQEVINNVYNGGCLMLVLSTCGECLNGSSICLGVNLKSNLIKDVVIGNNLLKYNNSAENNHSTTCILNR